MPPKDKAQQKADQAKRARAAEDKTFGLKNKNKSKAVQKFIKAVSQGARDPHAEQKAQENAAKKNAAKAQQQQALLLGLASSIGEARKQVKKKKEDTGKIDLYKDARDEKNEKSEAEKNETMENWTQEQLESVVKSKAGKVQTTTDIVCKYFLDAVEKRLYGWFWVCPNGGENCKYRHALPPGFVLKKPKTKEEEEEEEETPIEELIEQERKALPPGGTPVTLETFKAWKIRKEEERKAAVEENRKAEAKKTNTKGLHVLSGRDLFTYDPTMFVDDDGAASEYECEESEEEEEEEEVNKEMSKLNLGTTTIPEENIQAINKDLFAGDGDIPADLDELSDS